MNIDTVERSKLANFGNLLISGVAIQFIFLFPIFILFLKPFQLPGPFSNSWSFFNFSTANLVNKLAAFLNLYSNGLGDTTTSEKDSIYVLAVYSGSKGGEVVG